MICIKCGDGVLSPQKDCPHCKPVDKDKQIEILQRDLGDAIKILTRIRDMDYRGNRNSAQTDAYNFLERFR
jgi:hypothetical protein